MQTFGYFLEAFKTILTRALTADSMRSLALYITYAIHKQKATPFTPVRGKSIKLNTDLPARRKTLGSPSPRPSVQQDDADPKLTQLQVALRVLEMYADLLCCKDDTSNIRKFARTVTNKVGAALAGPLEPRLHEQWLLHLLADDEPAVVVLAAKILARLLVTSGASYVQKFVEKTGGVIVMQHRLRRWWSIPTIWPICFAIFFGLDVGTIDFARSFDLFGLLETFASGSKISVVYPAMLPVITTMLEQGLKTVTRDQSDPESPLAERSNGKGQGLAKTPYAPTPIRQRSMTLNTEPIASS